MANLCYISFKGIGETENITFLFENDGKDIWKRFSVQKEKRQIKDFLKKKYKFITTKYTVDRLSELKFSLDLDKFIDIKDKFLENYKCEEVPNRIIMMQTIERDINETEPDSKKVKGYQVCKTYKIIYEYLITLD